MASHAKNRITSQRTTEITAKKEGRACTCQGEFFQIKSEYAEHANTACTRRDESKHNKKLFGVIDLDLQRRPLDRHHADACYPVVLQKSRLVKSAHMLNHPLVCAVIGAPDLESPRPTLIVDPLPIRHGLTSPYPHLCHFYIMLLPKLIQRILFDLGLVGRRKVDGWFEARVLLQHKVGHVDLPHLVRGVGFGVWNFRTCGWRVGVDRSDVEIS